MLHELRTTFETCTCDTGRSKQVRRESADLTEHDRSTDSCPICGGGPLERRFSLVVLAHHNADYCECSLCGSLVIPNVHWLTDAYDEKRVDPDTGAAQRSIISSLFIRAMQVAGIVSKAARIIDFGAGNGLLVRLLRDQGFDAWGYDNHSSMGDCRNYRLENIGRANETKADMMTAIEVFEHLTDPCRTMQTMVSALANNGVILLRTSIYDASCDENWQYLEPAGGQHITFYSHRGLQLLAEKYDLRAEFLPFGFHMLTLRTAPLSSARRAFVFIVSSFYFLMARAAGLCDCSRNGPEKKALAEQM